MKTPNLELFDSKAPQRDVKPLASPIDDYPRIEKRTKSKDKNSASTLAREHASRKVVSVDGLEPALAAAIQRLNTTGKKVLYVRMTQEEKDALKEVTRLFEDNKVKLSDTEVGRLALNYLLEDHRINDKNSLLSKVLARKQASTLA